MEFGMQIAINSYPSTVNCSRQCDVANLSGQEEECLMSCMAFCSTFFFSKAHSTGNTVASINQHLILLVFGSPDNRQNTCIPGCRHGTPIIMPILMYEGVDFPIDVGNKSSTMRKRL